MAHKCWRNAELQSRRKNSSRSPLAARKQSFSNFNARYALLRIRMLRGLTITVSE